MASKDRPLGLHLCRPGWPKGDVDFKQPLQLPPGELLWPIAEHQHPEVVHTVDEFLEACLFQPQVERVVVLPNGIRLLEQDGAMPDLLTWAVQHSTSVRQCLDFLQGQAAGKFRGRLWHYAKRGEEKEIKRQGDDKSLDAASASFKHQVAEGKIPACVPLYLSELRWLTKIRHPIEQKELVKTSMKCDIYDATMLSKMMPLWERSEGGIFVGERGTGSGLHVDQCLWSNVGRNWCGFKLLALWGWEDRKKIMHEMGKGHVFHLPLNAQEEAALRRAKTIALVKPGDVWVFSGAQPHTALVVGDGLNLSAYESYVPANADAIRTLVSSNTKDAHIKHCWMDDDDLDELYEDVVDNIQRALRQLTPSIPQHERLHHRLRDCVRAMREDGDAYCKQLWREEDEGKRYRKREDSPTPQPERRSRASSSSSHDCNPAKRQRTSCNN